METFGFLQMTHELVSKSYRVGKNCGKEENRSPILELAFSSEGTSVQFT